MSKLLNRIFTANLNLLAGTIQILRSQHSVYEYQRYPPGNTYNCTLKTALKQRKNENCLARKKAIHINKSPETTISINI